MKYALFLCGALALAASAAHADYVCEVNLSPPSFDPTHGMYGDIQLTTSMQPNSGGATKRAAMSHINGNIVRVSRLRTTSRCPFVEPKPYSGGSASKPRTDAYVIHNFGRTPMKHVLAS